jgi:rSAM/selenodomain-associated transferase 2
LDSPSIAVVIPTLNEEEALGRHLPRVLGAADEVVVSDGGSSDGTVALAREAGALVVSGGRGRGLQLNAGAAATAAAGLVFLHADTLLPASGIQSVRNALRRGFVGGGFLVHFDSKKTVYGLGSRLVNLRTRWTSAPLGDQAQFASRAAFEAIAGYPDWPVLEDLDFIRRLKKHGRIALLSPPVATSPRRFEHRGIVRTLAINWLIFALYFLGVSPSRLSRLYEESR